MRTGGPTIVCVLGGPRRASGVWASAGGDVRTGGPTIVCVWGGPRKASGVWTFAWLVTQSIPNVLCTPCRGLGHRIPVTISTKTSIT